MRHPSVARSGRVPLAVEPGAPAPGPTREHVRVVEEPVEHRGDGRGVAEELAPVLHGPIRREQRRGALELRVAASALTLSLQPLELRSAADLDGAFAAIARERAGAILTIQDGLTNAHRAQIVALVTKSRLPAMYETRGWTEVGG